MSVITRIAPSPTGFFHIGTARTALVNYLYAKKHDGSFVIRIEDTDKERSKAQYETDILEGLAWLGLKSDKVIRQSDRKERHTELLKKLIDEESAYISKEESRNKEGETVEVVRLKNTGRSITFYDEIRGDITFDTSELGDFVIARAINDPLYHFAVVVDDMDMNITHVIRGEDHISNTPRQILIQEALGATRPVYAHLPLILDAKRAKLSKRSGATSVADYRNEGILPEALINYLALLGWHPSDDREEFTLEELTEIFSLTQVQKSGAAWDREKLLSVNQQYMRHMDNNLYISHIPDARSYDTKILNRSAPLLKERARTFNEAGEMLKNELACLFFRPNIAIDRLLAKELEERPGLAKKALEAVFSSIQSLPESLTPEDAKSTIMPIADREEERGKGGRGAVLWPLRYALSGQERSPDPFTLLSLIGTEESSRRIAGAIAILS